MLYRILLATQGAGSFPGGTMTDLGLTNVRDYGATGDGSTDDTSAVAAAIAALPADGGVLYFPPGTYKTSGGFTLSTPCMVIGAGGGGGTTLDYGGPGAEAVGFISQVVCTSATAVLFDVTSSGVQFHDLSLVCTATATNGAGIRTSSGGGNHAQYVGLTISGFYIAINHQYGREYAVDRCYILDWVYAGLRHQNIGLTDEGEVNISDCWFIVSTNTPTSAAIEIVSGGGIRIAGCQFVGIPPIPYMIALPVTSGTSNLLVSNCTFEGYSIHAIFKPSGTSFANIIITGCQMEGTGLGGYEEAIKLTDVSKINIGNNLFASTVGTKPAVTLSSVSHAVLVGNYWQGYSAFLGGSSQTDVNSASNYGA